MALPFQVVSKFGGVLVVALVMASIPARAAESLPDYSGDDFKALYDYAIANTLPNLEAPNGVYVVTGNEQLDERLWDAAFERGYDLTPTAGEGLSSVAGIRMQPQAAEAWVGLRATAREAGMRFIVSSAYRSPSAQRTQFLSKLKGTSDAAIDATLTWYSLPGTSKHHGGYALDFRYSSGTFGEFRSTPDYAWLSADNFSIPLGFGLIPSYPDDVENQGPNPEPWEFVWVGENLVACGLPQPSPLASKGPVQGLIEAIGACPGGMVEPAIPAWLGT